MGSVYYWGWYELKVGFSNFRMLNVIPMVITKEISIENTLKEIRESKCVIIKSQLNAKGSNKGNE